MEVNGNLRQGGMLQMHERAILVGGALEVRSAKGEGTRVLLRIPRAHA
jgi:signal transduction histidine kinase